MGILYYITYYTFGWAIIFLLNLTSKELDPGWFWAVDWCFKGDIKLIRLGIFTVAWGEKYLSFDWNID